MTQNSMRLSWSREEVDQKLTAFRFDEACNALYHFFWGDLCDWSIELAKPALAGEAPRPRAVSERIAHWHRNSGASHQ